MAFIRRHAPLDQVPFSCSLCGYRACRLGHLKKHFSTFADHKKAAESICVSDDECIQKAEVPYRVRWAGDLTILSPEASQAYFSTKVRSAKRCALDDIPIEEDFLPDFLDILIDEPSETMREEIRVLKQEKEEMRRQLAEARKERDQERERRKRAEETLKKADREINRLRSSPKPVGLYHFYGQEEFDELFETGETSVKPSVHLKDLTNGIPSTLYNCRF